MGLKKSLIVYSAISLIYEKINNPNLNYLAKTQLPTATNRVEPASGFC